MRILHIPFTTFLVAVSVSAVATAVTAKVEEVAKPNDYGIFEWIHNSPGGYYNPKQEFRYEIPNDPTTIPGVYATQDIKKGEVLVQVPWDLVLKSDDPNEERGQMACGTVAAVAREMKLDLKSKWAPYVRYLNTQMEGQIPAAWSEPAKALLREIVGGVSVYKPEIPPAEPTEWLVDDWYGVCKASKDDSLGAKAALLVVQRSDDNIMIPAYDMYNHRNGKKWMNTDIKITRGEKHVTKAKRDIKAGEQIYISYNHCAECGGRNLNYGTGEILRDYGFVESYPREYHYMGRFQFMIDEVVDTDGEVDVMLKWNKKKKPDDGDYERGLIFFKRQIKRLQKIKDLSKYNYPDLHNEDVVPKYQLDMILEFVNSNILAMTKAIEAIEDEFVVPATKVVDVDDAAETAPEETEEEGTCSADGTCSAAQGSDVSVVNQSHYDTLEFEFDDIDYSARKCDDFSKYISNYYKYYDVTEEIQTAYQSLNFGVNQETGDICMDIEEIIQICSCYRPQYHEYVVHAAARYVEDPKRIIFIGGGDSMILHEALKYPNLELVVGLELDQVVVRKSFKHFKSQPHFDDPRVEWWFGDATKSLLLLQQEYWRSFDLVLVDLSETVMSLSVTDELDVFDALGLLLKPDGVMVKNEYYMPKFSEVFDYTMQIYYESPIICSQAMVMGSNSVDFFTHQPKDHGVHTLLYEPMVRDDNKLDLIHDYSQNDARAQGKCDDLKIPELPTTQGKAAGILTIVNAEKTTAKLDDGSKMAKIIGKAIEKQGFALVSDPTFVNGSVYCVMKEGYVIARLFPDKKYCAFDVNLWGTFHKSKQLQAALVEAVGSSDISSYRVVVGGMFGSSTWKEDQAIIGPQIVQTRNCDIPEEPKEIDASASAEDMIDAAIGESIKLSTKKKNNQILPMKAVVFCGLEGNECVAADALSDYDEIKSVHKVFTCPGLDAHPEVISDDDMHECEYKTLEKLESFIDKTSAKSRFDFLVVDSTVPYSMVQVLNSILGTISDRKSMIRKQSVFVALSTNPEGEEWRQHFLDRYRKQHKFDPVSRGHVLLKSGKNSVGFGVVISGDEKVPYSLESFASKVEEKFDDMKKDVTAEVTKIHGGKFPYMHDFEPNNFLQSDYDETPGQTQFDEQVALGRQNIFQLVPAPNVDDLEMSNSRLKDLLKWGVDSLKLQVQGYYEYDGVGDGSVQIFVCEEGSVVGVWDGKNHIDINLFTYEELPGEPEKFIAAIIDLTADSVIAMLRDDQPRGIGRVVNLPSDMGPIVPIEKK